MTTDGLTGQQQTLRDRGICVVIPTYNNGGTIGRVVREAMAECADVIVVDDGSNDGTGSVLGGIREADQSSHEAEREADHSSHEAEREADQTTPPSGHPSYSGGERVTIVTLERNSGKGAALKAGFRKATEMGFSYAITLDGDGQHFPREIATMLKANQEHPWALVIGSRWAQGPPIARIAGGSRFANRFSNFWFWLQTGRRLSDTQTGYRLYPLRPLRFLFRDRSLFTFHFSLLPSRYEAELELLVFASWHGVELVETPVSVYYPPQEERVSHFRPGRDFARISVLNTVLCVLAVVYGLPLRLWRWAMRYVRTVYALLFFLFFMFVVIKPVVWVVLKVKRWKGEKANENRWLHRLMYRASRFVMLTHGIPGVRFSYGVAPAGSSGSSGASGYSGSSGSSGLFSRPRVVICNHQSHLDLFCQLIFTPDIIFLTNDWVWNNPSYGLLIRNAEYYPVREGLEELLPKLRSLVERGYSIAVYPEGTRSSDCRIQRFHQGAFWLAEQLGVDILPMCLYGPGRILRKKTYTLHRGPVRIEVGEPVGLGELRRMGDFKSQAKEMRRRYIKWYEAMANRIERE